MNEIYWLPQHFLIATQCLILVIWSDACFRLTSTLALLDSVGTTQSTYVGLMSTEQQQRRRLFRMELLLKMYARSTTRFILISMSGLILTLQSSVEQVLRFTPRSPKIYSSNCTNGNSWPNRLSSNTTATNAIGSSLTDTWSAHVRCVDILQLEGTSARTVASSTTRLSLKIQCAIYAAALPRSRKVSMSLLIYLKFSLFWNHGLTKPQKEANGLLMLKNSAMGCWKKVWNNDVSLVIWNGEFRCLCKSSKKKYFMCGLTRLLATFQSRRTWQNIGRSGGKMKMVTRSNLFSSWGRTIPLSIQSCSLALCSARVKTGL